MQTPNLKKDRWDQTTVDFSRGQDGPRAGDRVDEIHPRLPRGAVLMIDDLILYEPGVD